MKSIVKRLDIPTPQLFILPEDGINICSGGLSKKSFFIAASRGFINKLSDKEQEALIAHELAHIHRGDTRVSTLLAAFLGFITLTHDYLLENAGYIFHLKPLSKTGIMKMLMLVTRALLCAFLLIFIFAFAPLFNMLVKVLINPKKDLVADIFAIKTNWPTTRI